MTIPPLAPWDPPPSVGRHRDRSILATIFTGESGVLHGDMNAIFIMGKCHGNIMEIPVVPHKAVAEVSKIGNL